MPASHFRQMKSLNLTVLDSIRQSIRQHQTAVADTLYTIRQHQTLLDTLRYH
jgi:hypothetical protein